MYLSGQLNCRSLRCSWSIACRRCSNYIFILDLKPGFKGLGKDDFKTRWESFQFWDLVRLILETLRYIVFMNTFVHRNTASLGSVDSCKVSIGNISICHFHSLRYQMSINSLALNKSIKILKMLNCKWFSWLKMYGFYFLLLSFSQRSSWQ